MNKIRFKLLILGLFIAAFALFFSIYQRGYYTLWQMGSVERIDAFQAEKLMKESELTVLDVREENEYNISHLPGAIRYQDDLLDGLSPDQPILVYCTVGLRSNDLAKKLSDQGFRKVYEIKGGILSWANKGKVINDSGGQKTDTLHTYNKFFSPFLRSGKSVY